MGLLNPDAVRFLGHAFQQIGALGHPAQQAALRERFDREQEERRRAEQYRGLLSSLGQPQGGGLSRFDATTSPPITSGSAPSPNSPEGGLQAVTGDSSASPTPAYAAGGGPPEKGTKRRAYAGGTDETGKVYKPAGQSGMAAGAYLDGTPKGLLANDPGQLPGLSGGGGGLLADPGQRRGMFTPEQLEFLKQLPPEAGMEVVANRMFAPPAERKIIKGADGFSYYADTGQRVLPGVQAPATDKGFTLSPGQARFDASGKRIAGLPDDRETNRSATNILLPNGERTPGYEENGMLFYQDRDGQYKPAPYGASKIGVAFSGTEAREDQVRTRKFREFEDATTGFMQYGRGIVNAIDTGAPLFGTTGWLAQTANSWRAQAEQIGRAFGGYTDKSGNRVTADEETAELMQRMQPGSGTWDKLRSVVGDRTDVLGTGIALAYMRAKMLDPTGRVSDADLENSMRSLGFDTNDPAIIRRSVVREMEFMNRLYRDRVKRDRMGGAQQFKIPGRKQEQKRQRLKNRYGLE